MFSQVLLGVLLSTYQSPKVSLELRGVRLENAAPILAKTFGWSAVEIGPSIKDEILLVRAQNVDPKELRDKLASTLNATWMTRGDTIWLAQTDEQKSLDKKRYSETRLKFFRELTEKAQKRLGEMLPFTEANCKKLLADIKAISTTPVVRNSNKIWMQINQIDRQSPANRFGLRAALRLRPEVWMRLSEENPRIVFCNRPNGMQQPMPFEVSDLIAQTRQEQDQWSAYAGGEPLSGPSAGDSEYDGMYWLGNLNQNRQPYKLEDFDLVTMIMDLRNQTVEFSAYNKKGKRTFESQINFYEYSEDENYDYKAELEKVKKKQVKLEGDAAEYLNLVSPMDMAMRYGNQRKPMSPSLTAKLLQPEIIDPLSIAAPDVFLASIQTPNVVMVLNDYHRQMRYAQFNEPRFRDSLNVKISDENGWFTCGSNDPIFSRKLTADRKRLGPMLRFMYKNQRPLTLEEQSAFTFSLPWDQESNWIYQAHFTPFDNNVEDSYNDPTSQRIYGSMTDGERERARKSGLPLSQMSDQTKKELFRAIFYAQRYESRLEMDWSAVYNNGDSPVSRQRQTEINEMQEKLYGGIFEEKTFVLPNGVSSNFVLKIEDNTNATLYAGRPTPADGENYYGGGRNMTAESLGDYLFKIQNPQRYRWEVDNYNKIDQNSIQIGTHRSLTMKLQISPLFYFNWQLSQTLITDPKVYTTKNLPQSVLDEIAKGYKQAEKNDKAYGNQATYGPPPTKKTVIPPI